MKFIINKEVSYTHEDRVRILKRQEAFTNTYSDGRKSEHTWEVTYLCNAVIKVTNDWNIEDEFSIVSDTDSIQYRPKGIFGNKKGYFYKNGGTIYLTKEEVDEMLLFIQKARIFLENSAKKE
jgi:hypothetical protein